MVNKYLKLLFLAWVYLISNAQSCFGFNEQGTWGASTIPVFTSMDAADALVPSPNGSFVLSVKNYKPFIERTHPPKANYPLGKLEIGPPLTEIGWAQNSNSFFLNISDGGEVGTWMVHAFKITSDRVVEYTFDESIMKRFLTRFNCGSEQETPNFAGIRWTQNNTALLIVGEMPPHSGCKYMGTIRGYEYSFLRRQLLREYSEAELIEHFHKDLGARFARKLKSKN